LVAVASSGFAATVGEAAIAAFKVPGAGYALFFAPGLSADVAAPFVQSGAFPQ
jgi:hypothetical protein